MPTDTASAEACHPAMIAGPNAVWSVRLWLLDTQPAHEEAPGQSSGRFSACPRVREMSGIQRVPRDVRRRENDDRDRLMNRALWLLPGHSAT